MGRASRAKRERRQNASAEAIRHAGKADRRGLRVGTTLSAHVDAVRRRGADGLAEALIARHNRRMANLNGAARHFSPNAFAVLHPMMIMDTASWQLGQRVLKHPCDYGATWLEHLGWAADSASIAIRYLLCGQVIAASVVARSQLERWTENASVNAQMPQLEGEATAAWIDRLMSPVEESGRVLEQPEAPIAVASEVGTLFSDAANPEPVGQDYEAMSEVLHGRGPLLSLVRWEAQGLLAPGTQPSADEIGGVLRPLQVALRRVREGLAAAALDRGYSFTAERLATVTEVRNDGVAIQNVQALLFPLEPMALNSESLARASGEVADQYRAIVEGRPGPDLPAEVIPALAFGERRYRAHHFSRRALQHEAAVLGEKFDDEAISETLTEMVFAAECSASLASWVEPERIELSDAFAAGSSALRSTVWMWLEDDDRAMGCGRTVLEMVARLRTFRLKPQKAAQLAAQPRTTPRDWIDAAGWRRLSLLNSALGDLAHAPRRAASARQTLVMLQIDPDSELASKTGRTSAVNMLIFLLQVECGRWVDSLDATLGAAFWEVVRLDPTTADQGLEPIMRHAWNLRTARR